MMIFARIFFLAACWHGHEFLSISFILFDATRQGYKICFQDIFLVRAMMREDTRFHAVAISRHASPPPRLPRRAAGHFNILPRRRCHAAVDDAFLDARDIGSPPRPRHDVAIFARQRRRRPIFGRGVRAPAVARRARPPAMPTPAPARARRATMRDGFFFSPRHDGLPSRRQ